MSQSASEMSDVQFELFRTLFLELLGLYFEDHRRYLVEKRVATRMGHLDMNDYEAYLAFLHHPDGSSELQSLTNAVTVNETYFNREQYQLDCLTRSLLPEILSNRARQGISSREPIRIWSIPCSSGEEPYSIVMQLLDEWAEVDNYEIEIHASDVDTEVLSRARTGLYGERALRLLPEHRRERYFRPESEGLCRVRDAIRGSVTFSRVNLNSEDWCQYMPLMDVIFCRNLLIYFNDDSRSCAAEKMFGALRPGGFICLGHSESMHRMNSSFLYRRFPEAIVYQRPPERTGLSVDRAGKTTEDLVCG